jgi:GxxExxY protein
MPILVPPNLRRPTQDEFGDIAYRVMEVIFAVHRDLGRFMEEEIYQREIARRLTVAQIEIPLTATFEDFAKTYFADLLVDGAAFFELKAVESLAPRHRSQLINYLLLAEMPHGKLINFRGELVEHEFVNATLLRPDRCNFEVCSSQWHASVVGERDVCGWLIAALHDWGVGLDFSLYEDACIHFFGGKDCVHGDVEIVSGGRAIGVQAVRLAAPGVAFKVTTLPLNSCSSFEDHARRFLAHTPLTAIHWINIAHQYVLFKTLLKSTA